jgi:hypothetical protein
VLNQAFSNHRESEMGEGREIAAGAHRSAGRNDGMDTVIEQGEESFEELGTDPATSFGENVGAEQEHGADLVLGQGLAESAGVAAHEIALKVLHLGGVDADVGKLAEAGVDAIGGFAAREQGIDYSARGADARRSSRIESDKAVMERDCGDFVEGKGLAGKQEHHEAAYSVQRIAYRGGSVKNRQQKTGQQKAGRRKTGQLETGVENSLQNGWRGFLAVGA